MDKTWSPKGKYSELNVNIDVNTEMLAMLKCLNERKAWKKSMIFTVYNSFAGLSKPLYLEWAHLACP